MRKLLVLMLAAFPFFCALTSAFAEDESKTAEILKKLDDISDKQNKILTQLDAMKQELYVIKIRATKK